MTDMADDLRSSASRDPQRAAFRRTSPSFNGDEGWFHRVRKVRDALADQFGGSFVRGYDTSATETPHDRDQVRSQGGRRAAVHRHSRDGLEALLRHHGPPPRHPGGPHPGGHHANPACRVRDAGEQSSVRPEPHPRAVHEDRLHRPHLHRQRHLDRPAVLHAARLPSGGLRRRDLPAEDPAAGDRHPRHPLRHRVPGERDHHQRPGDGLAGGETPCPPGSSASPGRRCN
jgi:hypothetical protein